MTDFALTFGIITDGTNDTYIQTIIKEIQEENIPNYEIIVVGKTAVHSPNIIRVTFEGSESSNLPKKKNMICRMARYDTIVLLHDYVGFKRGWYEGYLKYGANFDLCVNPIENNDGTRYRDFLFFYSCNIPPLENKYLLPYDYVPNSVINRMLYISGAYYIIKKRLALEIPLNETLLHNMAEDVVFSHQCVERGIRIQCNPFSRNYLLKQKVVEPMCEEIEADMLDSLSKLPESGAIRILQKNKTHIQAWLKSVWGVDLVY